MTYSIYRSANAIHYIYNNISEDIYILYKYNNVYICIIIFNIYILNI